MLARILYPIAYLWRLLVTYLGFTIFGLGSLVLGYLLFPLMRIFSGSNANIEPRAQYAIHLTFRLFAAYCHFLGVFKLRFTGFETLRQDRGCLIVSNHPTLVDYVLLVSRLPRCTTIVKAALWQNIFVRKLIATAGYLPNRESDQMLETLREKLHQGENILIFPEGTRSCANTPLRLKRGTAQIALRTQAPIRVIYIRCRPITLTKEDKWYRIPHRRVTFEFSVGPLLKTDPFKDMPVPLAARKLTQQLTALLEQER